VKHHVAQRASIALETMDLS